MIFYTLTSLCNILRNDILKILLILNPDCHSEARTLRVPCQFHLGPVGVGSGCPVIALSVVEYLETEHSLVKQ